MYIGSYAASRATSSPGSTGTGNVVIGRRAGYGLSLTGDSSRTVIIGHNAGAGHEVASNCIVIGANALGINEGSAVHFKKVGDAAIVIGYRAGA